MQNSSKNKLLLVYPFKVDEEKLQEISSNLTELGGNCLGVAETFVEAEESDNEAEDGNEADRDPALSNTSSRMHYVTIREDDMKRLSPGQFLNDALVDFWMSWYLSYFCFALNSKPPLIPFDLTF